MSKKVYFSKPKIYLDCSVFGGYYDREFEKDTIPLFKKIFEEEFRVCISTILETEIATAPQKVQEILNRVPLRCIERVKLTQEAITLREQYFEHQAISSKHINDANHIAISSVNKVDILISWNFKHIVNAYRIKKYNIINQAYGGYPIISIVSPKAVIF